MEEFPKVRGAACHTKFETPENQSVVPFQTRTLLVCEPQRGAWTASGTTPSFVSNSDNRARTLFGERTGIRAFLAMT
ncbi:hypothetical protein FHS27_002519 [Rhodopirellula rubra]|uniref:Uncharacterized protein n=1 Tax=Aporhodopirellula rubra TaxID=980271 RepID=A0A7W5H4S3_9BACT|nr:hypothetical protein [Aporhodopirellula rubra]